MHILKSKFGAERQQIDNWCNMFVHNYNARKKSGYRITDITFISSTKLIY